MNEQREFWVVGCGNMGGALVRGAISSGKISPDHVVVIDRSQAQVKQFVDLGARTPNSTLGLKRVVILAVKPGQMMDVIQNFEWQGDDVVVSVAAGVTLARIREALPYPLACARAMPNTPVTVGKGVTGMLLDPAAECARLLFETVGEVVELQNEGQFDALIGISGSGPAYMFMTLSAMSDGGVKMGLDRATANRLAVMTMLGSAELALQSDKHFETLKDQVTSPGGTTIEAVMILEKLGFRHALNEAVCAAASRSRELSEKLS